VTYRLLETFRQLFDGHKYLHRRSTLGDKVAQELYEDLYALGRSPKFVEEVKTGQRVLNVANRRVGLRARRGDGTFGEIVPGVSSLADPGYAVARGPIATIEIGAEVKVLAKAMIKQIDRVGGDLVRQAEEFRRSSRRALCVGIVGINHAPRYTSYEGEREYHTDGSATYRHPIQEAQDAVARLRASVRFHFDEFLMLHFCATNEPPFAFRWADPDTTLQEYGAALTRLSIEYERRF
jgi:hypothetical protein